jgi:hypothetical protein
MSAEGKKKRGLSGQSNAKSIAFRYGGSKCDYSIGYRPGAASHPRWAGSKLVQAFTLGTVLSKRYPFKVSQRLAVHVDAAMGICTASDFREAA